MRLLSLCFAAATLAPVPALRHVWSEAVSVESARYAVETDTFPEAARSLLDALERSYPLFEERFGPLEGKGRRRMRLALFYSREEYMELGGGVEGAVGHFDAALDRCSLVWRDGDDGTRWPIAIHEACHHYFHRRHPDLLAPSWYTEGIACWFEGVTDPSAPGAVARLRAPLAKEALSSGEADLGALLSARAQVGAAGIRLESFRPARFYALAWSLVHFLATDPSTREGFRRFELRLFASRPSFTDRDESARRILAEECGDLVRLERGWRDHVARLPVPAPEAPPPVYAFELRARNPWERYVALTRLRAGPLPARVAPELLPLLSDPDFAVRAAAARAVAPVLTAEAVPPLLDSLDTADRTLRQAALRALANPAASAAVPRLVAETRERDLALDALAAIGHPDALPLLRTALLEDRVSSATRARIASALRADGGARAALELAQQDADASVRVAASQALAELDRAAGAAEGPDPGEAYARRSALERAVPVDRSSPAALLDLLSTASAPEPQRLAACALLGDLRASEAIPLLRRLCGSAHPDRLRIEAMRALVRITGETRGYRPGQGARAREAALRAWAE
jgi:HEAT repeat protein